MFYVVRLFLFFFFFNDTATTEIYTLSLHDALPICSSSAGRWTVRTVVRCCWATRSRSEEHTSELQSRFDLVCRLLLEKKKEDRHADGDEKKTEQQVLKRFEISFQPVAIFRIG